MRQRRQRRERIANRFLWASLLVLLIGAGTLVYWLYFRVTELRVAVSNPNGEDAATINAINDWLVSERRRFRLRVIPTGSPTASLEKLRLAEVEIAVARGDRVEGNRFASVMVLFNEVAGVVMPANSPAKDWAGLNRVAIGVPRGTAPDDPLLLSLLRLNGVPNPRLVSLETDAVRGAIERKQVQALGFVSPLPGYAARNFHLYFGPKSGELTMPTVDDPDLQASKDKRFTSATIVPGSLRTNTPVPSETIGTLSVGRHMLVRTNVNALVIAQLVRNLIDARRALFSAQPLLKQAGSPDLEADSFIKVHDAAKKIYNGDEPSWRDMALEWIYLVPMILGAIGSLAVWIFQRYVHPDFTDPSDLVTNLLEIKLEASRATTEAKLHTLLHRVEAIAEELTGEAYEYADIEGTGAVLSAILIAENQINERRAQLRDPAHALKREAAPQAPAEFRAERGGRA